MGRLLDLGRLVGFVWISVTVNAELNSFLKTASLSGSSGYRTMLRGSASSFGQPWRMVETLGEAVLLQPWFSAILAFSIFRALEYQYLRQVGKNENRSSGGGGLVYEGSWVGPRGGSDNFMMLFLFFVTGSCPT